MNKTVKVTLIVGAIIVGIGLIVAVIAGFAGGWNFVSTEWNKKVYEAQPSNEITDIDVDFAAGSLEIGFYEGSVIKVEYPENSQISTEFSVVHNTLKMYSVVRWHVQFGWFNKIPTTKVYIPNDMQPVLRLKVDAGTVTVKAGSYKSVDLRMNAGTLKMDNVDCSAIKIQLDAGTINLSKIECQLFSAVLNAGTLKVTHLKCNDVKLALSAGTARVGIDGKKSDYTIWTDVSAGSCNVKNQNGTIYYNLNVVVSAGSAKITFSE